MNVQSNAIDTLQFTRLAFTKFTMYISTVTVTHLRYHFLRENLKYLGMNNKSVENELYHCTMAQALKKFGIKDFAKMMTLAPIFTS